jgi:hemolysin III
MSSERPRLRGKIHQLAFYLTIAKTLAYSLFCMRKKSSLGILIYLISQLLLFGISSTYHTTTWKSRRTQDIFQLLDHASIFLLISGTQTSVVLTLIPVGAHTKYLLLTTWSISLAGILKIALWRRLHHTFDLAVYILHGASVVPFIKIIYSSVALNDLLLFALGGAVYIAGGLIYGFERPNPYPAVFGYHEIFHVMTVLANWCFLVPLFKGYLLSAGSHGEL